MCIRDRDNIIHLMDNHHFEVVRHDVTYPYSAEVDEIYNLACPASPIPVSYTHLMDGKPGECDFRQTVLSQVIADQGTDGW